MAESSEGAQYCCQDYSQPVRDSVSQCTADSVVLTFEEGAPGVDGSTYGSQNYLTSPPNFRAPLVRDGYVLDVEPSLPTELYPYHFHEVSSADAWWLPVRTNSGSGVLARDSSAGEDPLVITRQAEGETFVVRRVSVGFSSSQDSATSLVRMSGYREGTLVGSTDFSMAQNTYTDYEEAELRSLAGASVDRLEFLGFTSGGEPYALYMLDDIELIATAP